jgi:hypothetical protein
LPEQHVFQLLKRKRYVSDLRSPTKKTANNCNG